MTKKIKFYKHIKNKNLLNYKEFKSLKEKEDFHKKRYIHLVSDNILKIKNNFVIIRGYGDYDPNICTFYKKTLQKNAIKVIENYLATQTDFDSSIYPFEIRNADDSKTLYTYYKGQITNKDNYIKK